MPSSSETQKYKFLYLGVYQKSDILDAFHAHLKHEFNSESLDFVLAIEALELNNVQKTLQIIDTFIKPGAKKEINVSGKVRNRVLELSAQLKGDTWTLKESSSHMFAEILTSVHGVMAVDTFVRFIRTPEAEKVYSKYLGDTKVCIPALSAVFSFKNSHFNDGELKTLLNESDVLFAKELVQDSFKWKIISSERRRNDTMQVYVSDVRYFPNVSIFNHKSTEMCKFEYTLPFNFVDVYLQVTRDRQIDNMIQYNICEEMTQFEIGEDKMTIGRFDMDVKLPWPLSTMRKYKFTATTWYDEKNESIYWINKQFVPKEAQGKDIHDKIRFKVHPIKDSEKVEEQDCYMFYSYQIFVYQKISEETSILKQVHINTWTGWSGVPFLRHELLKVRGKEIRRFAEVSCANPLSEEEMEKQVGLGKVVQPVRLQIKSKKLSPNDSLKTTNSVEIEVLTDKIKE